MAKRATGGSFDPLGWMFTFSDLVTLLLTFFVMLLAMKEPQYHKFQAAFGIFKSGSTSSLAVSDRSRIKDVQELLDSISQPASKDMLSPDQKLARDLRLPAGIDSTLESYQQQGVELKGVERGMVITLANDLLFAPGSAGLSSQAGKAISKAARLLRYTETPVSVEGHSDDLPPRPGGAYGDNWELSLARAQAVLRRLVKQEKINPGRLRVAALADSRPMVPNDSPEHRAMNRRTELVLLTTKP